MTWSNAEAGHPAAVHACQRGLALLLPLALLAWALSPLGSLWAGMAWLALCLAALLAIGAQQATVAPARLLGAARRWWWANLLACLLVAGALLIWRDPLSSLQDNARLLLGAGAVLLLLRHGHGTTRWPHALMDAAAAACAVSVGVALLHHRDHLPSNAIPWAVSVALLVCLLAPVALQPSAPAGRRRWWVLGLLLGLAAVMLSQTRGAMVIGLWLAVLLCHHGWTRGPVQFRRLLGGMVLLLAVLISSAWWPGDPLRLHEVGSDLTLALRNDNPNTPVGSRLEMWQLALDGVWQSPWLGHGISGREASLQHLASAHDPMIWGNLRHFHNEYLNAWYDHGLLGLGAVVLTWLGIAGAAHTLRHHHPLASQQLWGLAVMHGVAGLTNVNTAHNLYALTLSLAVAAALLHADLHPGTSSGAAPDTPSTPIAPAP